MLLSCPCIVLERDHTWTNKYQTQMRLLDWNLLRLQGSRTCQRQTACRGVRVTWVICPWVVLYNYRYLGFLWITYWHSTGCTRAGASPPTPPTPPKPTPKPASSASKPSETSAGPQKFGPLDAFRCKSRRVSWAIRRSQKSSAWMQVKSKLKQTLETSPSSFQYQVKTHVKHVKTNYNV